MHVEKSRVWSLRQFFHYFKLKGLIRENIAKDLPYPDAVQDTSRNFFSFGLVYFHAIFV